MKNRNILWIALAVAGILLVPLVAMQFTDEVNWSPFDFVFAGVMLFGTGLAYELISRRATGLLHRAAIGVALGTALFLLWANLAVGIIGSEDNPANAMYLVVLLVFVLGLVIAGLRPRPMARALYATAFAQALVTAIAFFTEQNLDVFKLVTVNGFFITLWVIAAVLFGRVPASGGESRH